MSEQDLNQAKSKGGSLSFKSVRAVSALCSLSMKFRKHLRVTIEKKEKYGTVENTEMPGPSVRTNTNTASHTRGCL